MGVIIYDKLSFLNHCQEIRRKVIGARARIYPLIGGKSVLDLRHKLMLIIDINLPIVTYAFVAWGHVAKSMKETIKHQLEMCS